MAGRVLATTRKGVTMLPLFEHLQEAIALKRFLDELEKHPKRTLLALGISLLLAGTLANAAYQAASPSTPPATTLSQQPASPATPNTDGTLPALPYPAAAEAALQGTLADNAARAQQLAQALASRPADDPITAEEARLLSESGQVRY